MKITAIIPSFNSAEFISEAIISIKNQSHPVDEIIVVDDGSNDNTAEIIDQKFPDVICLIQKNQGPSTARNTGIQAATGDWIAFLDADDQWLENKMALQQATLQKYPQLHLIAADMREIDNNHQVITESVLNKHHLLEKFQQLDGAEIPNALAALVTKNFIPTGTVLVKRDSLLAVGLFNPKIRFGEDLELWAKLANHYPISCLPQALMLRRLHDNNATQCTDQMLADLVKVTHSICNYAKSNLIAQKISPKQLQAHALKNLAYWHFNQGNKQQAFHYFQQSFLYYPNLKTFLYGISCLLPARMREFLRTLKQRFIP